MQLKESQKIGFGTMVLLGINGIVGSGIFLLPGTVMQLVGNWSSVVYLLVTLLVLSIAWCFAQCAALFNRNGGAYVYAKEAFGDFVGFEVGIMRWAVGIIAWAALAVGFVTALSVIWPPAMQEPVRSLIIVGMVGGLGLLNILGVSFFKYLNNVVTIAKLFCLVFFVVLGFLFIEKSNFTPIRWEELPTQTLGPTILLVFYAFGGFETLVVAAGEMKNPQKNLPIAVMMVISFCSLLYFLIQLTATGLLGQGLAQSEAPLADSAQLILGDFGRWFIGIAMLISIGGINISASFVTPRSGVALAEDGMIPGWIAQRGRFGSPVGAIGVTVGLTILLAFVGNFSELAVISVVSRFVQYISTCLAVLVFHFRQKQVSSRWENWKKVGIPVVALIGMGAVLTQATSLQIVAGLGALLVGLPLYGLRLRQQANVSSA